MLFNQVSIVGVGLIGASLAKSIKKKKLSRKIIGFFRDKNKLNKAVRQGIVDRGFQDLKQSIKNSDLIILALPISQIVFFLKQVNSTVEKETIIIDVGSTKSEIVATANKLKMNFIGTHPLAGSEKKGFEFSCDKLFNNSIVFISPGKKAPKQAIDKVKSLWKKLDANIISISPQLHDKIISFTSHLPHVIAFSLINTVPKKYLKFSATGLKDTTRIALSDSQIWSDIFLSNKKSLLPSIEKFEQELKRIKTAISQNRQSKIINLLEISKNKRQTL